MKKMWKRKRAACLALVLVMLLGLGLSGCGKKEDKHVIRLGTKDFTENVIIGRVYASALEDAGYEVEVIENIAGSIIHTSLVNDEIDLYPEYTGTGLLSILKMDVMTDAQKVYDTVKDEYKKQFDLVWLDYSAANDGQGLVIRTETAERLGITTISDVQKNASALRFASQGEFDEREDGMKGLEKLYGPFEWKSSKVYSNGLKYSLLLNDEADVAPAYTTEGQLVQPEFTLLVDDKQLWPPYNLAPVVRQNVLDEYPEIEDLLNKVSALLTTENVTALNAKVDVEKQEADEVAEEFYGTIKDQIFAE
ncbi:glycine betaine ABC transporter substrate-binding protein [Anaerolentibacter hominis]|uniref:glycine betaine ABC transporter substrate-binding protein n=1 Tax=Anaerolentibacter hominis TaxID=3079009 RepID=UPI0031B88334